MRRTRVIYILLTIVGLCSTASSTPVHLRCEYRQNPLGIDALTPHLSWQSDNTERNWKQAAYQVLVASALERLQSGQADAWDSGKIDGDESVGIVYKGKALESRKRYYWKVRVWDGAGRTSESTEEAWWEMGLLRPDDWTGKWIYRNNPEDAADRTGIRWIWAQGQDPMATKPKTVVTFRTTLNITEKPQIASLFVAVHGAYQALVNGHEVGNKSRWDAFDRRDIASELVVGPNSIEVNVTTPPVPEYGPAKGAKTTMGGFAALIKLTKADGTVVRRSTDDVWEARIENVKKVDKNWHPAQVTGDLNDKRFGDPGPLAQPAAYFRRAFDVDKTVRRARLYVTALGSYQLFLNGKRVGNDVLTPGFTDYRKRVLYQTYDVTDQIKSGANVLGACLGDGWYGSPLTWVGAYFFTPPNRLMAQLELEFAESYDILATDNSWKTSTSPILQSQIYSGELFDARLEKTGWNNSNFDDSQWQAASLAEAPAPTLSSQPDPSIQQIAELRPKTVTKTQNGAYVFDMGQNMVGWATLKVKGAPGTKVQMRFAEILNPDGTIYTANLRNAEATDTYILRGNGEETFAPHFTFHGFRYVEVSGYPGTPPLDAIQGNVLSSVSGGPATQLKTSSNLVNRMWEIGLWGQRGNFLSIPTDCPQRDERLGWMGDAGVFWRTGSYNFDIAAFSQKFIQDIVDAQSAQGAFTNVAPDTLALDDKGGIAASWGSNEALAGAPGWGDAGVIVPWTTWVQYGDKGVIEKYWDAMERWMKFIESRNPDFIRRNGVGPDFSDWLAPDTNTNKHLLATAYWALIANMMSQMAHALGKDADAQRYDKLISDIRSAFQKAYIQPDGTVGTGTQTSYVVTLYTKLAPENLETALVDKLVKDIEGRGGHLSTGFLGTPFLLFTLADHGRSDVAYRLLLNETYPSWGYMLSKGATTWWERWNGDTGDPAMNSYNHYAFGSVIAWVYRDAAGIDTTVAAPGFKEVVIHPHVDAQMSSARAEYESVYGKIVSDWKGTPAGPFSLRVTIPANTSAKVYLPAIANAHVSESGSPIQAVKEAGALMVQVGSGTYNFEVK